MEMSTKEAFFASDIRKGRALRPHLKTKPFTAQFKTLLSHAVSILARPMLPPLPHGRGTEVLGHSWKLSQESQAQKRKHPTRWRCRRIRSALHNQPSKQMLTHNNSSPNFLQKEPSRTVSYSVSELSQTGLQTTMRPPKTQVALSLRPRGRADLHSPVPGPSSSN